MKIKDTNFNKITKNFYCYKNKIIVYFQTKKKIIRVIDGKS